MARDLVVLIPGIGGSVLAKDGRPVWSPSPGAVLRGVLSLGKSVKVLTLNGDDPEADDLGDGVSATSLVGAFHVVPGLDWKIDVYDGIRSRLLAPGGYVAGQNFFEFPYDWRRHNVVAARRLARLSHDWLTAWRRQSGDADARLILVAHSMGGIISRIFLEQFEGWRSTRQLVTFGTPYGGSLNALNVLANGFRKGWGPFTVDLTSMLRSFPSVYELLPSYRCMEGANGAWVPLDDPSLDWSGTDVDADRVRQALTLHRGLRRAVDDRLAADHDPGYVVRPVAGDFQRTGTAARLQGRGVEVLWQRGSGEYGGDGTVPKLSALPHEYLDGWRNTLFVSQHHGSMQNDRSVLDHVVTLARAPEVSPQVVYPAPATGVPVEVDDVVFGAEPLVVRALPAEPVGRLTATVESMTPDALPITVPLQAGDDGWARAEIEVPPGDYRVSVAGAGTHTVVALASVVDVSALNTLDGPDVP